MSTAVAAAPTAPAAESSIYASLAYRWRVIVTAVSLIIGIATPRAPTIPGTLHGGIAATATAALKNSCRAVGTSPPTHGWPVGQRVAALPASPQMEDLRRSRSPITLPHRLHRLQGYDHISIWIPPANHYIHTFVITNSQERIDSVHEHPLERFPHQPPHP